MPIERDDRELSRIAKARQLQDGPDYMPRICAVLGGFIILLFLVWLTEPQ